MTSTSARGMSPDTGAEPHLQGTPPGGTALAPALFALASIAFVAAQASLWTVNGYWFDEYYSLWTSDPRVPLATLFGERIFPDTNPPLYYSLILAVQFAIEDARTAFTALNGSALVLAISFVLVTGRRAGLTAWAWTAAALLLVSGPVVAYASEGRAYLISMCTVFSMAWACAVAIERPDAAPGTKALVILGMLAGLIHAYAALMAGALAAGLVLEGLTSRRPTLLRSGLTLGGSASLTVLVWLTLIRNGTSGFNWITFSASAVREAAWFVGELTFGDRIVAAALLTFILASCARTSFRALLRVFVAGAVLFVAIPLVVSFIVPLILGRYWLIGAPAVTVLGTFAVRAHLSARTPGRRRLALVLASAGAALMLCAATLAFDNGRQLIIGKWDWVGAPLVQRVAPQCGSDGIRVWGWPGLYALAADAPESLFIDAMTDPPLVDAAAATCPVLGWAEHVWKLDEMRRAANDDTVLDMLRIRSDTPGLVRIERHDHGVLVLRADAGASPSVRR